MIDPPIHPVLGVDSITASTGQSALVQYHMVDQTAVKMPPVTKVQRTSDNGVRTDMYFLDQAMD